MRYEAVGNNLHGALAGEDHREDDFNFFLKRNRVNNLPWSVDGAFYDDDVVIDVENVVD